MNKFQIAQRSAIINAHLAAIRTELARHPEVAATLKLFPPKLRPEVLLKVNDYNNSVSFTLTLRDLESFKDKQLTKLLAKFAGDEWLTRSSDYTYSDTPNRDFAFTRKLAWTPKPSKHTRWLAAYVGDYYVPTSFDISVNLFTYVKSDSPLCRIVVAGVEEEVVRKEIKQIVCA